MASDNPSAYCRCGLPEEQHIPDHARGSSRFLPRGYGPCYSTETYHWEYLARRIWTGDHIAYPWGEPPPGYKYPYRWIRDDGSLSLEAAHKACNKTCALFIVAPTQYMPMWELCDQAYAAWFHHAEVRVRRLPFLMELWNCVAMAELKGVLKPDDLQLQTTQVVRALVPIHQKMCELVQQKLDNITPQDIRGTWDAESLEEYTWLANQWGVVNPDLGQASDMINTFSHYHLRDQFAFEPSFSRCFTFVDEGDIKEKGMTLVKLGDPEPGSGWTYDEVAKANWMRDKTGVILERLLQCNGLPPSEHPDIMHGRKDNNLPWEPSQAESK